MSVKDTVVGVGEADQVCSRECMGLSKIVSAMVYETVAKARDGG